MRQPDSDTAASDGKHDFLTKQLRMRRIRPAPTAPRIAISFRRAAERDNCRFATFTMAINSTRLTAPSRMARVRRVLPTSFS